MLELLFYNFMGAALLTLLVFAVVRPKNVVLHVFIAILICGAFATFMSFYGPLGQWLGFRTDEVAVFYSIAYSTLPIFLYLAFLKYNKRRLEGEVVGRNFNGPSQELAGTGYRKPSNRAQRQLVNHTVFLSYRRADSQDVCGRIYEHLERELGQGVVFKDVDSLKLGVNFKDELTRTLEHCKVALIVMGPNWIGAGDDSEARITSERDYVRIEAEAVLRRDIPVIPVFVRGAQTVDVSRLPETLTELDERNGIQIRPDPDFKNDMSRLVSALQKILG